MAKKYKAKMSYDISVALTVLIDKIIQLEKTADADTRLMLSGFEEVKIIILKKMIEYSKEYKYTFTAVQAHALRLLYENYIMPNGNITGYLENRMHQISNEIQQHFQN